MILTKFKIGLFLLLALSFLKMTVVLALEADRKKPIRIRADNVQIDEITQTSIYTGNVIYEQGTIVLNADKATLVKSDAGIQNLTALGKPAVYQEIPEGETIPVIAKGETIHYNAEKGTVTLTQNASVEQKNDTFKAPKITYFFNTKVIQSTGRTDIIMHPENHPNKKSS